MSLQTVTVKLISVTTVSTQENFSLINFPLTTAVSKMITMLMANGSRRTTFSTT